MALDCFAQLAMAEDKGLFRQYVNATVYAFDNCIKKVLQSKAVCVKIQRLCFSWKSDLVGVAQLVRASDCGSEGRGFESLHPPQVYKILSENAA